MTIALLGLKVKVKSQGEGSRSRVNVVGLTRVTRVLKRGQFLAWDVIHLVLMLYDVSVRHVCPSVCDGTALAHYN